MAKLEALWKSFQSTLENSNRTDDHVNHSIRCWRIKDRAQYPLFQFCLFRELIYNWSWQKFHPANRNRTSDLEISDSTQLQSPALPAELSQGYGKALLMRINYSNLTLHRRLNVDIKVDIIIYRWPITYDLLSTNNIKETILLDFLTKTFWSERFRIFHGNVYCLYYWS